MEAAPSLAVGFDKEDQRTQNSTRKFNGRMGMIYTHKKILLIKNNKIWEMKMDDRVAEDFFKSKCI